MRGVSVAVFACSLAACAGSAPPERAPEPAEKEAHRESLFSLTPPDSALQYTFGRAVVESLEVRLVQEPAMRAEVLVRGYVPDGCTELHEVRQVRQGWRVEVELITRRPVGVLCTQAIRPFRYYLFLPDVLPPGQYELVVNGYATRFRVP
jgi:inhibitor of cysteine peptidase|nr:MAG: hypothetical protein KatS3mg041_1850 [Bacteroidota bacterium]